MIARLRTRHRRIWLVLAFVLPAVLVVAWRARRPAPLPDRLPPALLEKPAP